MRTASLRDERWVVKAAGWNPELSTKYETYRAVGRPKKRWEDEINEFPKPEETETTRGNNIKNNNTRIKEAKNRERWRAIGNEYAKTAAERSVDTVLRREPSPQDPRHLNGVWLDDDEVANITKIRKKRRCPKLCRNINKEWIKKAKDQQVGTKGNTSSQLQR